MTGPGAPTCRALFVLGMHRSGTSALSGTLWRLGLDLGTNLMPPEEGSNSLGFYEHNSIVPIHEVLLRAMGSHWSDTEAFPDGWLESTAAAEARAAIQSVLDHDFPAGRTADWGMKDPRLCRFVPLWRPLLKTVQPCYILVRRDPAEVAASLEARDGMAWEAALWLWWRYMSEAERDTRGAARIFVDYDELLGDWRGLVTRISDAFAVSGLTSVALDPTGPGAMEVDRYLDPAERHHRGGRERDTRMLPEPVAAFDAVFRAAIDAPLGARDARFAELDHGGHR
ncbi:MAG: hypothetical protein ISP41_04675 [Alphaproteobacteria bacterium]|jgi:hypothetical protein|nr:hypothetical protein [Alphaproteobacteria bacterium]